MKSNYAIGLNVMLTHLAINPLLAKMQQSKTVKDIEDVFPLSDFALGCQMEYPEYSYNECENIYRKFFGAKARYEDEKSGIFYLIYKIAKDALQMEGSKVCCNHSELLSWRETAHFIGQTVFICSFLAQEDVYRRNHRSNFSFPPCTFSNNYRLRNMLSLGMAENHFHLKGSAPAFHMSWVCLMNSIERRKIDFERPEMKIRFFRSPIKDENLTLHKITQIAAFIRFRLNNWLDRVDDIELSEDNLCHEPHSWIRILQRKINTARAMKGMNIDYASNFESETDPYSPISGENRFLYRMFHAIYSDRTGATIDVQLPFLVYLMSYIRLRGELVQSNKAIGFHNFEEYQKRKDLF